MVAGPKTLVLLLFGFCLALTLHSSPGSETPGESSAATGRRSDEPVARITVSLDPITAVLPDIGVNELGDSGGTHFSAGSLIPDGGFEPRSIRHFWRVTAVGAETLGGRDYHWIQVDAGGMTNWDLVTTGYLNGAGYRLYRLVDAGGAALPLRD